MQEDKDVSYAFEKEINAPPKPDYDPIHAHLERINLVARDRGIKALINVSDQPQI